MGGHDLETILRATEETSLEKASRSIDILRDAYESAPGADPGNAWGALQALTYFDSNVVGRGARAEETRINATILEPQDRLEQVVRWASTL